jgi:integrase
MASATATVRAKPKGKHQRDRLSSKAVANMQDAGYYADGAGLYLRILPSGGKSWSLLYMQHGRQREMMIGPYPDLSLLDARSVADVARAGLREGVDPIEKRKAARATNRVDRARETTFKTAAEQYIESQRAGWKNAKHASQWENTLEKYVYPIIGKLPVADVDKSLVLKCLTPIWNAKPETASRVRGRIENVLDWSKVQDLRAGDNPAEWKGNLEHLLPSPKEVKPVKHHAAMAFEEVPAFAQSLRQRSGISARALEFAILSACRSGEVLGARWSEVDLQKNEWVIPAERMKAKKEHRVPVTPRMREVLLAMQDHRADEEQDGYVFPGANEGKPLSNMALTEQLRGMASKVTVHGFRSSFRDWAGEVSGFPREVIEHALAHQLKDKAEASYARGSLFLKRRKLMEAWSAYCEKKVQAGDVVTDIQTASSRKKESSHENKTVSLRTS